jgi:hypothetical protein
VERGIRKVRLHSHSPAIGGPMVPVYFPISGSRHHSSSEEAVIRSTEITRIDVAKEGQYTLQEP